MVPALLRQRLTNQGLARASVRTPEDIVAWFGAVQAQDYLGAMWGIGQRLERGSEAVVEAAEAHRAIVRTWPMRGTLHFVAAADARWMTRLLAPRVLASNAARWKREFDVDAQVIARARDVVRRALEGGRRLERGALYERLDAGRIPTRASRGLHILLGLAMEGTLCLAGRAGRQHTFALLDDWLPATPELERDAALARLAERYFTSHGPATRKDFAWWAGLTASDVDRAIDGAKRTLDSVTVAGVAYLRGASARRTTTPRSPQVRLLPAYDEYTVGYADRSALTTDPRAAGMGALNPVIVIDGCIAGTWKRTLTSNSVSIDVRPWRAITPAEASAVRAAGDGYGDFLGRDARVLIATRRSRARAS